MFRPVKEVCVAGAVVDVRIIGSKTNVTDTRSAKSSPTASAVQKNNDRIAERRFSRLINANFFPGDYHLVLTYADAPSKEEAERELRNFIRRMKREFKKLGKDMRYATVTEHLNKRIHHHVLMSYIDLEVISRQWRRGIVRTSLLDKTRNYRKLAEYLIKETTKTFRDPKVIEGYSLDEGSVREYDHPITGITHQSYCMVSNDPAKDIKSWQEGTEVNRQETYLRFDNVCQTELKDFQGADYTLE